MPWLTVRNPLSGRSCITTTPRPRSGSSSTSWASREALVSRGDDGEIIHAELRWPAGGTILFGSAQHHDSVHGRMRPGAGAMYVPTGEVGAIYRRARAGYLWTFGTYPGAP
ncbi:MAG TPA: hypothetical protein VGL88_15595 [Pseudonocardiaceae bacterium]